MIYSGKTKNKKFPVRNYRLTTEHAQHFHRCWCKCFGIKNRKNRQGYNDGRVRREQRCNIPLAWPHRTSQPNGPANFALGSASSQLQEVLVTDLPRSFNSGEREKPEREEGERERWKREGEGEGEARKGQVFQLSLQHLSDPSDSGCILSQKLNKNITYCTY